MKSSKLLCLYGLFYSLLVHASDYKKVTSKPEYLTMHQAFIRLVHNNPDKSLDDLEHAVYKTITPMQLYTNVMMLKQQKTENFEDKKMSIHIAQLCAIARIKVLLWQLGMGCNQGSKPGIVDRYIMDKIDLD